MRAPVVPTFLPPPPRRSAAGLVVSVVVHALIILAVLSPWLRRYHILNPLGAGSLVLYPSTSLHRVEPITRGARVASFFWIQSLVREDAQRSALFDLDMSIVRLTQAHPGDPSLVSLTGVYHNLLRMWATP